MRIVVALAMVAFMLSEAHAGQSIITEMEGYACMGDDKSRKETESLAVTDAKRKAAEYSATYIQSESHVKDMALEKDLIRAYANAQVKILQELAKSWIKDASSGDCFTVKLKVEVAPDEKALASAAKKNIGDDPSTPLAVSIWTDKKDYRLGDKIRVYLKGNKPFYGLVTYKDAGDNLIQLLPNPYRRDNYFNGGVVYELPSGGDQFELEVSPPFGSERITVYASTAPVGEVEAAPAGGVYEIKGGVEDVAQGTRGISLVKKGKGKPAAAEFSESETSLKTDR